MSGFDEVLGTKIEVRKRILGASLDKDLCDGGLEQDLFPEFTKLLEDAVPGDDESEGCPLPGTPEDESLIDAKEVRAAVCVCVSVSVRPCVCVSVCCGYE